MKRISWSLITLAAVVGWVDSAWAAVAVEAFLYNPTSTQITLKFPYNKPAEEMPLKPSLALSGTGFRDGAYLLRYVIEGAGAKLAVGTASVTVQNGWFRQGIELKAGLPTAKSVTWELSAPEATLQKGSAPLSWSRFRGKVKYRDGKSRSSYIDMQPEGWGCQEK